MEKGKYYNGNDKNIILAFAIFFGLIVAILTKNIVLSVGGAVIGGGIIGSIFLEVVNKISKKMLIPIIVSTIVFVIVSYAITDYNIYYMVLWGIIGWLFGYSAVELLIFYKNSFKIPLIIGIVLAIISLRLGNYVHALIFGVLGWLFGYTIIIFIKKKDEIILTVDGEEINQINLFIIIGFIILFSGLFRLFTQNSLIFGAVGGLVGGLIGYFVIELMKKRKNK